MTALSAALEAVALFLVVVGLAKFGTLLKGCLVLRRLARSRPSVERPVLLKSPLVPVVSVVAIPPASFAEGRDFARRLLDLQFANHEVVVVLDAPDGDTLARWSADFHLALSARAVNKFPAEQAAVRGIYESMDPVRLVLVDLERTGKPGRARKADAWNAGIRVAAAPVVGLLDPDCEFDPALLLSLMVPILEDPERTIAVCGVDLPPAPGGFIAALGALESLRIWLGRGAAFAGWNLLVPVPGASMLVRREILPRVGGLRGDPLRLFLDLHAISRAAAKGAARIAFVPDSVSHSRAPRSWVDLGRRIARDQAQLGTAIRHRGRGGLWAIGWGLPALFVVRWICPLLETAAYAGTAAGWILGWIQPAVAGLVLFSTVGIGILVSMAAVGLRELAQTQASDPVQLAVLFLSAIPENLGYRQLRNLWLIAGFFRPA